MLSMYADENTPITLNGRSVKSIGIHMIWSEPTELVDEPITHFISSRVTEIQVTAEETEGHWRYAVRQIDEDGDVIIWSSHSSYSFEPFRSAAEAHGFASGWMDNFEVVRTWIPKPQWETVPESEWSKS